MESCQTGRRPHKATRNGCCLATGPSRGGPPASSSAMVQKASMRSTPKNGPLQTIGLRQPEEPFDYITPRTSKLQTPEGRRCARIKKVEGRGFGRAERGERAERAGRAPLPVRRITLLGNVGLAERQSRNYKPKKGQRPRCTCDNNTP